jgi:replicative DNA helicase
MENENNLLAEQSVIGGLIKLNSPDSELVSKTIGMLKPTSFYTKQHQQIFSAIKIIFTRQENIDLLVVQAECKRQGNDDNNLFVYLAEITRATPSAENILNYAKLVREYSIERFALTKLHDCIGNFNDKTQGDVYQRIGLLESTFNEIGTIASRGEKSGLKHISEALGLWLDSIEQATNDGHDKNAFTTGIESLDEVLGVKCVRRGSLVGVGARPKMGKSAFMMLLANHFALDLNEAVAIFSMEMPNTEISERAMTSRATINPAEFYRTSSNEIAGRRDQAMGELINSNMFVDDGTALSISHIERESRKIRKDKGSIGLICVDYLTLMSAEKADRNDLAYGMITKRLKNLAKELDCVVLLLTQLNRGLESRPDKRPMPSDSRDTGQLEQDVDLWIGLYKDSVYNESIQHSGLTELIVRLNRHGGTGTGFVEMRQGFHVPVSTLDGARMLNDREQNIIDEQEQSKKNRSFRR